MARLFYIMLLAVFVSCGEQREAALVDDTRAINKYFAAFENKMLRVENLIPDKNYNIELVETDSLHSFLKITYSQRLRNKDNAQWVDAVLRMPVNNEQRVLLEELLYGEHNLEYNTLIQK